MEKELKEMLEVMKEMRDEIKILNNEKFPDMYRELREIKIRFQEAFK